MHKFLLVFILFLCVIMATYRAVATNHGSASAEVLSNVVTINVTRALNMGRFYSPRGVDTELVIFVLSSNGFINHITTYNPSGGYSHVGGQVVGEMTLSGNANTRVRVAAGNVDSAGAAWMSGPSNQKLQFYFSGVDVSTLSAGQSSAGSRSFLVSLDGNGRGRVFFMGTMVIYANALPGAYSLSFPVTATY